MVHDLTKREYFAALAMQALVQQYGGLEEIPVSAVRIADLMIAALAAPHDQKSRLCEEENTEEAE